MIGIDTLYLETKGIVSPAGLQLMKEQGKYNTWHHSNQRDYDCMQYLIGNDRNMPLIKHTQQNQKIRIEIPCVPYTLFGNSMEKVEDCHAEPFTDFLTRVLTEELGVELLEPPTDFKFAGMDIKHDFHLGDMLPDYIRTLSRVQIKRYKTMPIANEEVTWRNKSKREIKFYDKHKQCIDKKKSAVDLQMSKGIGRFEVEIKTSDVRRDFGLQVVTLGDVFRSSVTEHFITKFLRLLDMDSLTITTERDMLEILKKQYTPTMARKLIEYIRAIEEGSVKEYPTRTSARYDAQLKQVGVAPVLATKKLPPLNPYNMSAEVEIVTESAKASNKLEKSGSVGRIPSLQGSLNASVISLNGHFGYNTPKVNVSTNWISNSSLQAVSEAI